jgi:hypothetical protein
MTKYSVTFFDGEKNDTQFKNSKPQAQAYASRLERIGYTNIVINKEANTMDLETAKKLNEVLKPLGYTIGKIEYELSLYENAIKMSNYAAKFQEADEIEKERDEILADGKKNIEPSKLRQSDILHRHGIDY